MTSSPRGAGIFLSIASLPGPFGCGGFGEEARRFIDLLADNCVGHWQILPLAYGATHMSPYQAHSSFAKHHLYVDPVGLVTDGLLTTEEITPPESLQVGRVVPAALAWKNHLLECAYEHFESGRAKHLATPFREYLVEQSDWLLDFALYAALFKHFDYQTWQEWPTAIRDREPAALCKWELKLQNLVYQELFSQFLLDRQWEAIRNHAVGRNVKIIGDLPIYAPSDSADLWHHREYFLLNKQGYAKRVSGAPPDMFNSDGQKWGSPLYNWKRIASENFSWPIRRFEAQFRSVDILRIDHFLGYARFWSIPSKSKALAGKWVKGPGDELFDAVKKSIAPERFIMEDLGIGSPATARVLRRFGAPGMRVLAMELDYVRQMSDATTFKHPTVSYTSTHDSNTLMGTYRGLGVHDREKIRAWWEKLDLNHLPIQLRFVAPLLNSKAQLVIIPLTDVMGWGSDARFNTPGTNSAKNWSWRFRWDDLSEESMSLLSQLLNTYHRAKLPERH